MARRFCIVFHEVVLEVSQSFPYGGVRKWALSGLSPPFTPKLASKYIDDEYLFSNSILKLNIAVECQRTAWFDFGRRFWTCH